MGISTRTKASSIRDLIDFAIGGGWGKETEFAESQRVRVIRGTDFERIRNRRYEEIPTRFEKRSKVVRRELQPGDIILEISGGSPSSGQSTGRSFYVSDDVLRSLGQTSIPASFCRLVRFDQSNIDARFAYYSLQEMYASGRAALYEQQSTGISNFQFEHFLDSEIISLPPLSEQRRIAHILGTLDDKIESNRRMNETLEEMARAIFKDWFVDFGPVRAKMEGRDAYLPEEIWRLFPDRLVESGLGEVPEGWGVRRLGEFFPVLTGKKDANYATDDGDFPFFTCAVDQTLFARGFSFDTDAILLAGNGNFNVKWYRGKFEAYQRTYVLAPHNREYLGILFQLMSYRLADLTLGQKGTVVNYLTKGMITDYEIVLPDDAMLVCLSNIFSKLMACQEVLKSTTTNLSAVRDTLLPVLVSGEVGVQDADKLVEHE